MSFKIKLSTGKIMQLYFTKFLHVYIMDFIPTNTCYYIILPLCLQYAIEQAL